ncbi:MAG: 50S ribosomal protein L28 [Holosporales bacterium]|nr:50S ribosomal protein L28 [Holosporales bacterium]
MARVCKITGKRVMAGNNVSHANNKTRRRFLPNLQSVSFPSSLLKRQIGISSISPAGIRFVEKCGGIDSFLLNTSTDKLSRPMRKLQKTLMALEQTDE